MEVEITYRYSKLDNVPEFGLSFIDERENHQTYIRWVYFYLGGLIMGNSTIKIKPIIYPFTLKNSTFNGKILYKYKDCNDAQRQAKMIYKRIIKKL